MLNQAKYVMSNLSVHLKSVAATACCAYALFGAQAAQANEDLRRDLNTFLDDMENIQVEVRDMGYGQAFNSNLQQIEQARAALAEASDQALLENQGTAENVQQLLDISDSLRQSLEKLKPTFKPTQQNKTKSINSIANLVPTTGMSEVDTEFLDLESCADQLVLTAIATPLRYELTAAEAIAEIVPANINVAGQSAPNPVKSLVVAAKTAAKVLVAIADEAIRYNALCTLRNERKIAREYIQASQARYTAHKSLETSFDVVRPENLGGKDKWRYTFWMHASEDGLPAPGSLEVTKILASQLEDASDPYVELSSNQYVVERVAPGLYKLTLSTPTDQGLDFVRGFVIYLEDTHMTPGNGPLYHHYGVAHIRSDENSKTF